MNADVNGDRLRDLRCGVGVHRRIEVLQTRPAAPGVLYYTCYVPPKAPPGTPYQNETNLARSKTTTLPD